MHFYFIFYPSCQGVGVWSRLFTLSCREVNHNLFAEMRCTHRWVLAGFASQLLAYVQNEASVIHPHFLVYSLLPDAGMRSLPLLSRAAVRVWEDR